MLIKYLFLFAGFWALATHPAHAYLDPGTGSYFIQIVIATLAGGGYLLISSWDRVKKFVNGLSSRIKGKSDEDGK